MTLYEELKYRGLIESITSEELIDKLNNGSLNFYIGTDPTADSLHIGHLSSMLVALRLKNAGHHPYILVGGGTGLIGDPRDTSERNVMDKEVLNHNYECLKAQISSLFGCDMVNNYDWYKNINFIDYLRDYGKLFNVNYMLNKETVKRRLETGISYTEFSYMILQSIDFLHLYEEKNVTLQIGGQDQWGNITSGLELIRKKHGENSSVYGLTMPLITKADGEKFGKSLKGALWLDKNKTSSYEMYQYLVNSEDEKVIDYIKKLTFLTKEEIDKLEIEVKERPENRVAGKTLAYEVVKFLHGEEEAIKAKEASEAIFSGKVSDNMPTLKVEEEEIALSELLVLSGLCTSKSDARRQIIQGAVKVNYEKVLDENFIVKVDNTIISKGKKNIIKVEKM